MYFLGGTSAQVFTVNQMKKHVYEKNLEICPYTTFISFIGVSWCSRSQDSSLCFVTLRVLNPVFPASTLRPPSLTNFKTQSEKLIVSRLKTDKRGKPFVLTICFFFI